VQIAKRSNKSELRNNNRKIHGIDPDLGEKQQIYNIHNANMQTDFEQFEPA